MNRPTPSPKRYYQYPCMGLLLLLENIANDYEWAHCFSWEMLLMPLHGTIAAAQIYCWCIWIGKGNWKCCAPTQREGGAFDPNHWKNLGFDARRPACWTGRGGVCWVCHWKKKNHFVNFLSQFGQVKCHISLLASLASLSMLIWMSLALEVACFSKNTDFCTTLFTTSSSHHK